MAGGYPNVSLYCANDPVNGKDPSGLQEEDIFTQVGVREDRMGGRNGLGAARGKRAVAQVKNLAQFALELNPLGTLSGVIYGMDCFEEPLSFAQRSFQALSLFPVVGSVFQGGKIASKVIQVKKRIELINGGTLNAGSEIRNFTKIAEGSGIDVLSWLVSAYGGKKSNRKKMKGIGIGTYEGKPALMDVHWYECHGVGRVGFKGKSVIKWLGD